MPKPNFIVIGAGKCATTSLCDLLNQHPEVFISDPKEPNFFSHDENYKLGWDWYLQLFKNADQCQAIGEGSGIYTAKECFPETAKRISQHIPDCKLIYIVRTPLERIESLWLENASQGLHWTLPFEQSIQKQAEIYIDSSNYLQQIIHYKKFFSEDQILVLFYEDYIQSAQETLKRCFQFLNVDDSFTISEKNSIKAKNSSKGKSVDSNLLIQLRSQPIFTCLKKLFPKQIRYQIKNLFFKSKIKERPSWSQENKQKAIFALKDDSMAFLQMYGKPKDFWNIN